ncbi:MAG: TetR/AcrR family transcriptional regulator [Trueperella sp.]|nr:TetR/AcrR family transcriptional regulator [Trueperella sp.]
MPTQINEDVFVAEAKEKAAGFTSFMQIVDSKWCTEQFRNLSEQKALRILESAAAEFANHGYEHANTNRVAENAGISVGSLFNYFPTKENLFRHIVYTGSTLIMGQMKSVIDGDKSIWQRLEDLLWRVVESSQAMPQLVQLYHEVTSTGNRAMVAPVATDLEGYTANSYKQLIIAAQQSGEVRAELDPTLTAFLIDNIIITLQYSLACDYYMMRLDLYNSEVTNEQLVADSLSFIKNAIGAE